MGELATMDRPAGAGEDDGLGGVDPNSEEATGIPGGRQPGDDDYVQPGQEPEDAGAGGEQEPEAEAPPTPPADLPADPAGEEEQQDPLFELSITAERELGLKVSGNTPEVSVLKIKGSTLNAGKGQFDRGDRFPVVQIVQVTGDNDQDNIDTLSGNVKSTTKEQKATVCGALRLEEYLKQQIGNAELRAQVFAELGLEEPGE